MIAQIRFVASCREDHTDPVVRLAKRMHDLWQGARLSGEFTGTGLDSVSIPEVSFGRDIEIELGKDQVVLVTVGGKVVAEVAYTDSGQLLASTRADVEVEEGVEWED